MRVLICNLIKNIFLRFNYLKNTKSSLCQRKMSEAIKLPSILENYRNGMTGI